MIDLSTSELQKMLETAKREVSLRKRVYPRFVEQGRMKAADAEQEIINMQHIALLLEELVSERLGVQTLFP